MSGHIMTSYMTADAIEAVGRDVVLCNTVVDAPPSCVAAGDVIVIRSLDGCVFVGTVTEADEGTLRVHLA